MHMCKHIYVFISPCAFINGCMNMYIFIFICFYIDIFLLGCLCDVCLKGRAFYNLKKNNLVVCFTNIIPHTYKQTIYTHRMS